MRWPWGVNFSEPSTQGMVATRNFYLETEPGIKVGVWWVDIESSLSGSQHWSIFYDILMIVLQAQFAEIFGG